MVSWHEMMVSWHEMTISCHEMTIYTLYIVVLFCSLTEKVDYFESYL